MRAAHAPERSSFANGWAGILAAVLASAATVFPASAQAGVIAPHVVKPRAVSTHVEEQTAEPGPAASTLAPAPLPVPISSPAPSAVPAGSSVPGRSPVLDPNSASDPTAPLPSYSRLDAWNPWCSLGCKVSGSLEGASVGVPTDEEEAVSADEEGVGTITQGLIDLGDLGEEGGSDGDWSEWGSQVGGGDLGGNYDLEDLTGGPPGEETGGEEEWAIGEEAIAEAEAEEKQSSDKEDEELEEEEKVVELEEGRFELGSLFDECQELSAGMLSAAEFSTAILYGDALGGRTVDLHHGAVAGSDVNAHPGSYSAGAVAAARILTSAEADAQGCDARLTRGEIEIKQEAEKLGIPPTDGGDSYLLHKDEVLPEWPAQPRLGPRPPRPWRLPQ